MDQGVTLFPENELVTVQMEFCGSAATVDFFFFFFFARGGRRSPPRKEISDGFVICRNIVAFFFFFSFSRGGR